MKAARTRHDGGVARWAAAGLFVLGVIVGAWEARAAGPFDSPGPEGPGEPEPDEPAPDKGDTATLREVHDVLRLGYSFGRGHSMGIGYLRAFVVKKGFFAGYTYGLEGRLLTRDYTHLDAAVIYALWRLSFRAGILWDVELGLGGGRSRGEMQGSARAGMHVRLWWFSVGYMYQFATTPTPLPRWFSTHELSARFEIPVIKTKATRYRPPDAPAPDPALPAPTFY